MASSTRGRGCSGRCVPKKKVALGCVAHSAADVNKTGADRGVRNQVGVDTLAVAHAIATPCCGEAACLVVGVTQAHTAGPVAPRGVNASLRARAPLAETTTGAMHAVKDFQARGQRACSRGSGKRGVEAHPRLCAEEAVGRETVARQIHPRLARVGAAQ